MRKELQRQNTGFPSSHQGCMWSLMHILDYHRWHSVKKTLPRRKHAEGRRIRSPGSQKAISKNYDNGEKEELTAEAEPQLVKQHGKEASPAKKKTKKNQMKTSKAKQVTYPEKIMETSPSQKLMTSNQEKKDIRRDQFYDHVDLLELLKANKEVLLKFLQEPDTDGNRFQGLHKSNTDVIKLTKSCSFPVADSSRARSVTPSTLRHKQNEKWSMPKGGKILANRTNSSTSDSQEDSERFGHHGWNQLVMRRFKYIKQKLMHALQDSKKEMPTASIETSVSSDPFGYDGKKMTETLHLIISEKRSKIDGLDDTIGTVGNERLPRRVSRTSSLNESLSRYSQLFENSCRSEAKLDKSRSLRLKTEENVTSNMNVQKSTRRNLSLPDFDSLCSFLNGPPRDALFLTVKTSEDYRTSIENDGLIGQKSMTFNIDVGNSARLEAILETECQNSTEEQRETDVLHDNVVEKDEEEEEEEEEEQEEEEESISDAQQDDGLQISTEVEKAEPSESCTLEPCSIELPISEEICSNAKCDEIEMTQPSMYDVHSPHLIEKMDDPALDYVKDVLELSGFMEDEHLGTWYSMEQPLDPLIFKELELRFQQELDFTCNLDRQLLFDLVNETLVDIHERSYTYFPRALSCSGVKQRPIPKGERLVENVWTRISSYMSFRPELVQSLDDIVARDLAKGDIWMKLQWEAECVALEVEDLIFEELLDEIICS